MSHAKLRASCLIPDFEAIVVAFRRHTLLPLDDCLYALQATLPKTLWGLTPHEYICKTRSKELDRFTPDPTIECRD